MKNTGEKNTQKCKNEHTMRVIPNIYEFKDSEGIKSTVLCDSQFGGNDIVSVSTVFYLIYIYIYIYII